MISILTPLIVLLFLSGSVFAVGCVRDTPDTIKHGRSELQTIQMEASEYFAKMARRRQSLDRFLDSANFKDVVLGNASRISDDVHYQQLFIHVGTKHLVELWKAIRDFERLSERDEFGRILNRLTSEYSRNVEFNRFVESNFPELLISVVVPNAVAHESELHVDSPAVIDVLYGTVDPRMLYHLWLIQPGSFPQTRILVLSFFDLNDNCQAAVVLPV